MAYGEGSTNAHILLRTLYLTFDTSGRSRRTEVIYWWFATALMGVVLGFIATTSLSWKGGLIFSDLLRAVLVIPMFALFARRLHDQDRSGWWAVLLPLSIGLHLPDVIRWITVDPQNLLAYEQAGPHPLRWAATLIGLGALVLLLLPGTIGPNHYGDDPREHSETEVV